LTDTRHEFAGLFSIYEWLMVAVTAIVFGAVVFALLRYRRRGDDWPRGRDESKLAEPLYAVLLAAIAVSLITLTFRAEARIDPVSARANVRVNVVAFQWQWRFSYPGRGVTVVGRPHGVPEIVVPADRRILFSARSTDVIHSFWVPALRFKRDAFPDRTTRFGLVFGRRGTYPGRCAEFCGLRHAQMDFRVRAVSPSRFRAWIEAHAR
jgi:cytochrome c oxidase subunit 2